MEIRYKLWKHEPFLTRAFLSPVHTVAENCDHRRFLAVFGDSLTFLRQCGQGFTHESFYLDRFSPPPSLLEARAVEPRYFLMSPAVRCAFHC